MGGSRARITLRDCAGKMAWINDAALAEQWLAQWAPVQSAVEGTGLDDATAQRGKVIEAGLHVAQMTTGAASTPLASAIRALRMLNASVNEAKHREAEDSSEHGAHSRKGEQRQSRRLHRHPSEPEKEPAGAPRNAGEQADTAGAAGTLEAASLCDYGFKLKLGPLPWPTMDPCATADPSTATDGGKKETQEYNKSKNAKDKNFPKAAAEAHHKARGSIEGNGGTSAADCDGPEVQAIAALTAKIDAMEHKFDNMTSMLEVIGAYGSNGVPETAANLEAPEENDNRDAAVSEDASQDEEDDVETDKSEESDASSEADVGAGHNVRGPACLPKGTTSTSSDSDGSGDDCNAEELLVQKRCQRDHGMSVMVPDEERSDEEQEASSEDDDEAEMTATMQIYVETCTDKPIKLNVKSTCRITEVKNKIQRRTGIPAARQHLFYAGAELTFGPVGGYILQGDVLEMRVMPLK
eukprot:CAMPEP_0172927578 /NCGR_PEP_ID=MMETSP1075-20121228/217536_1 /TAXON_ID=2916 /ORGANISM="Ceratium fusus, Strain PA161109" /LENGTH=466 /DNA_ID=CAMNT_0013788837 /DNA_START=63 /DNA_END=1463 /DNA_ORIENTATION=+